MKLSRAFTLIELLMALAACAVILAAIYGVFGRAVHLRDNAMRHTRDARLRAHAAAMIRNDLTNGLISGGTLAATLQGSQDSHGAGFPGYLTFSTTTGSNVNYDLGTDVGADVQVVEYYITRDPESSNQKAGVLVRTLNRDILNTTQKAPPEERVLAGVESMDVSFYSNNQWASSWAVTTDAPTLPDAVRVSVQPAADDSGFKPAPIEILVPWSAQPQTATATSTTTP